MAGINARVDDLGRAYAGSQLQIQIYVNRHPRDLSRRVIDVLPSLVQFARCLRWVSPLERERFAEYQDRSFLESLELGHLFPQLGDFWPHGGPVWDALAIAEPARDDDPHGVLLVEAKSHPPEAYGRGSQASEPSRTKIKQALDKTKRWLGVRGRVDWTGPLYQYANRLAHLFFFREVVRIPCWLVNAYFLCDPHSPTTRSQWDEALERLKRELGLTDIDVPHLGEVFLEARPRSDLVGSA